MTLRYEDPTPPADETIMTRALANIIRDDITWLAQQTTIAPLNSVLHGTGEAGFEGIPLGAGKLLTVIYGQVTTIDVPQTGTYELEVGADGIPYLGGGLAMARGQVRIRLDGLANARKRIKAISGRATDRSISKNILRIAGAYNVRIVPLDTTSALLRSFRARVLKKSVG